MVNTCGCCKRQRVCPRCLGISPGIAAGDPGNPHPGPFTRELCESCERRVTLIKNLLNDNPMVVTDAADNTGDFT